jgi:Protein of unknown function (DUF3996)
MTPMLFAALLVSQTFVLDRAILDEIAAAEPGDEDDDDKKRSSSNSGGSSGGASGGSSSAGAQSLPSAGSASTPQGRVFGLGLQLGYPTAITIKYMLRPDQGIVAGLGGFSGFVYNAPALSIHVDYVWHPTLLTSGEQFALTWYFGGGGNLFVFNSGRARPWLTGFEYYYYPTNIWLAARVPFGLNLALTQLPFEIYLEVVPSVLVFPAVSFGLGAAIGGRFYF